MNTLETKIYLNKFKARIGKKLEARLGHRPALSAVIDTTLTARDLRVSRVGDGFLLESPDDIKRLRRRREHTEFAAVYTYWLHFADKSVDAILGTISDGQHPSTADFSFSSFEPSKTLLPDPHFFLDFGYEDIRQQVRANPVSWQDRSGNITWRGSLTGEGVMTTDPAMQAHPGVGQRLRMAVACKPLEIDFRFVGDQERGFVPFLKTEGLMASPVPIDFWASHKFAIDIDGYSNAWCNLFRRLLQGCCVLKVTSNFGFKQWYYHQLEPYVHYVPVKADLSDLAQQLDWVRSNDTQAREIAAQGQQLAQSLTWESESKRAGEIITRRWNSK